MAILFQRPNFRLGTTISPMGLRNPELPLPTRVLEQGKRVRPRGFRVAPPRGRVATGAAEAEALRIKREGIKVALGESSLAKLLDIKVPLKDENGDLILDSAGKPIMTTVRVNLGDLSKSLSEKIDIIQGAIESGQTQTRQGLIKVTALLESMGELMQLKGKDKEKIVQLILSAGYDIAEIFKGITGKEIYTKR